jgi:hypothetical protein
LLHAGFVYENNRFDALAIRVRLAPDAEHIKDKLRLLHLNNMKMYPLPPHCPLSSLANPGRTDSLFSFPAGIRNTISTGWAWRLTSWHS